MSGTTATIGGGSDVRRGLSGARIRLTWTDASANEQGFRVERASGTAGSFIGIATVGANVTTFTDTTAKASKLYRYRVQAFNAAGASGWSNTVSIRARR